MSGRSSVAVIKAGELGRIHLSALAPVQPPEVNKYEQNAPGGNEIKYDLPTAGGSQVLGFGIRPQVPR